MVKTNLLGLNLPQLTEFLVSIGEKPFRAKQLLRWIHHYGETDFARMTDLAKSLRERLAEVAMVEAPRMLREELSDDGTRKWLLTVGGGNAIETVFIPEERRGTLCVSSQVGCAIACTFCATGHQGFNRNLSAAEIIGQVWWANKALGRDPGTRANPETRANPRGGERIISNVVMMGMGEPLANFEPVVDAMDIMLDDYGYGLSRRRVTVSTSGLVPALRRLQERCAVALAVSLHASNDELRSQIMPINNKFPLVELLDACRDYLQYSPRQSITFEYVMLDGINDRPQHARELAELLADIPCKINLIPFNPFPGSDYRRSSNEAIARFRSILAERHYIVTIRKTRGDDIDAACGQLAGQVIDKTRLAERRAQQQVDAIVP